MVEVPCPAWQLWRPKLPPHSLPNYLSYDLENSGHVSKFEIVLFFNASHLKSFVWPFLHHGFYDKFGCLKVVPKSVVICAFLVIMAMISPDMHDPHPYGRIDLELHPTQEYA